MKRIDKVPPKFRVSTRKQLTALAATIKRQRVALELTQEQLAEKLGIDVRTMATIEQGRRYPSLPMMFYILAYLKIRVRLEK